MKLGLLVVLAVVVLLPSLSEGRVVSKCELKEKLGEALHLPRRYQRFKERILAIVICEANRRSGLSTDLVKVIGRRRSTTTARPTTTTPTTTRSTTTTPTTTRSTTTTPTTTRSMTTTPTTTPTTTLSTTTTPTTTQSTTTTATTTPTTTRSTTTTPTTTRSTTTTPTTTPTTTRSTTTTPTTTRSTTQATTRSTTQEVINLRRRREVNSMEESDSEDDWGLEELLEEGGNEDSKEEGHEGEMQDNISSSAENKWSDEEEDYEDEERHKEGGKRKRRSKRGPRRRWKSLSLGFYGIFQLSDWYFCHSGYHRSYNLCNTACRAFNDDTIMDDISCIVKTGYWKKMVKFANYRCFHSRNFFAECV